MSNEDVTTQEVEAAPPTAIDEYIAITAEMQAQVNQIERLRAKLDVLYSERGVPIAHTYTRLGKAMEYLVSARDYWDYEVVRGNLKGTKAERSKQEAHDLS